MACCWLGLGGTKSSVAEDALCSAEVEGSGGGCRDALGGSRHHLCLCNNM
jgi:hypothetical protein